MTAPILFAIWLAWELLEWITSDPLVFAAPFAGLACAAFGVWYY